MIVGLKVQGFLPNIDFGVDGTGFRHPQYGLNNCPTIEDWAACIWLDGNGVPKPTKQELTDAPYPLEYQQQLQLEALRQPVVVEGVTFPVLRADMGFYGVTHAARNEPEMMYPLPLQGSDGVIVAADASDVDRIYRAILSAISTRASQG